MLGCDLKEICERSMDIQLFSSHTNQQKLNERAPTSDIDSTDSFFEGPAFEHAFHLNIHNILKSIIPDSVNNKTMADVFKVDVKYCIYKLKMIIFVGFVSSRKREHKSV